MSMKTFMRNEAGKAIGRLKGTIMFVIKTFFVALVNLVLWLLPLVAMGYFAFKPFSATLERTEFDPSAQISKPAYQIKDPGRVGSGIAVNAREMVRAVESFLREIRFFKQP